MAARKPVIATNVGGAAEAIEEGESGFLIDSDDTQALTETLIKLLEKSRSRTFGNKGRRIVEEKFTLKTQLEATLTVYGI